VPAELTGRWTVERGLLDRRTGTAGRFSGVATFSPDGHWHEEGTLEFAGYRGPAHRDLRIADGMVWFDDGRPFHPFDLDGPVEHLCGEDRYAGEYRLDGDLLEVVWHVTGPHKDQRIESVYRRIA
jgi:hypothetical protein